MANVVGSLVINTILDLNDFDNKIQSLTSKIKKKTKELRGLYMVPKAGFDMAKAALQTTFRASMKLWSILKRLALATTAAFAAITVVITKLGVDFERTMSRVQALIGISSKLSNEFRLLSGRAQQLGERTIFTANQAAEAMSFFALAGFKTAEIYYALPQTLNLAAVGMIDMAEATDLTIKVMKGMGIQVGMLGPTVDVLAKAMTNANTTLGQLGDAFRFVGPIAKQAGYDVTQTAAAIMIMSDAGIQGEMAGTALRGIIARLAGSTPSATKGLKQLGIQVQDAQGKMLPLANIIWQMNRALSTLSEVDRVKKIMEIFQLRAGPGFSTLLSAGAEGMIKRQQMLMNSGGTAARIAKQQTDNLWGAWTRLKSLLSGIFLRIFKKYGPIITKVLDDMKEHIDKNKDSIVKIGETIFYKIIGGLLKAVEVVKFLAENWSSSFDFMANVAKNMFKGLAKIAMITGKFIGKNLMATIGQEIDKWIIVNAKKFVAISMIMGFMSGGKAGAAAAGIKAGLLLRGANKRYEKGDYGGMSLSEYRRELGGVDLGFNRRGMTSGGTLQAFEKLDARFAGVDAYLAEIAKNTNALANPMRSGA